MISTEQQDACPITLAEISVGIVGMTRDITGDALALIRLGFATADFR